jgi:hypothetical protein
MCIGNSTIKVCFTLVLVVALCGEVQGGLWDEPVVNPSFEERVLDPGDWSDGVLSWFEHGGAWEEFGTGETGNTIPWAPDGNNWVGLGDQPDSYIYQQIGTCTGWLIVDVDFYIGLREDRSKGPIRAAIWVGGDVSAARDQRSLDADVGATMVDSVTWTHADLGGLVFGIVDVSAVLAVTGEWPEGAPVWIQFENLANTGQMFIDDIKITLSGAAWGPDPGCGAVNVPLDTTLNWHTGAADPNSSEEPNPEVTVHYVYMSQPIEPTDPNRNYPLDRKATIDASGPAQYTPLEPLERDRLYLWRVDEGLGENPSPDPNFAILGHTWRFETIGYVPVLEPALPVGAILEEGEDVVLTVSAMNPYTFDDTGLTYQWYKVVEDAEDTELGDDSPSYEITDMQIEDEGYYYCRVTVDSTGDWADSRRAMVVIKRLMAHWPLDGEPNDVVGDIAGIASGPIVWGDGLIDGAAYFEDKLKTRILFSTDTLQRRMWTISLWVYSPESNAKEVWEDIIGSGPSQTYPWHYFYITLVAHPDWCEFLSAVYVGLDESGYVPWSWWPYPKEVWYNLVSTYDARTETQWFYVNGEQMDYADKSENPFMEFGPYLSLGADWNDKFEWAFTGWVDDVRFYSYPLDHFEVADLYMETTGAEEVCTFRPRSDLSGNCRVDIDDFAQVASEYLTPVSEWLAEDGDLDDDYVVDIGDIMFLINEWMVCNMYPTCVTP